MQIPYDSSCNGHVQLGSGSASKHLLIHVLSRLINTIAGPRKVVLQEPSEFRYPRPIPQHLRGHLLNIQLPPQLPIPAFIVEHHIQSQTPCNNCARSAERRGRRQRRYVFRRRLIREDIRGNESHDVGERYADGCEDHAASFMRYVVIVPGAEEDGRRGGTPAHQEGCEVGYVFLVEDCKKPQN